MACICSRTGVQTVFFWEGPQNKYFQIFGPSGLSGSYSALLAGNCRHLWTTWEQTDVAVSQWNLTYTVRLGTWTPSRITTGNLDFTLHCNNNFSAHRIIKCLGFHFCSLEHCLLCCTNLQYAAPKAALSPRSPLCSVSCVRGLACITSSRNVTWVFISGVSAPALKMWDQDLHSFPSLVSAVPGMCLNVTGRILSRCSRAHMTFSTTYHWLGNSHIHAIHVFNSWGPAKHFPPESSKEENKNVLGHTD